MPQLVFESRALSGWCGALEIYETSEHCMWCAAQAAISESAIGEVEAAQTRRPARRGAAGIMISLLNWRPLRVRKGCSSPRARAHGFRKAPLPVPEAVAAATWEAPGGAMPEGATPVFSTCESLALARAVTLTQSSLSTVTGQQRARPGHGHEYPNTRYRN